MKKLNLVLLSLTVLTFSCSRTIYQTRYNSYEFNCECPNLFSETYQLANDYGTSQLSRWYSTDNWRFDFQYLSHYWNTTNVSELSTETTAYRMTVPNSSTSRTIEVLLSPDSTLVTLSFFQYERVYKSRMIFTGSIGSDFNSRMDSLFWQHTFKPEIPVAIHDGSHFFFEGTRNGTYKMITRNSSELLDVRELIKQFDNLISRAPIFECEEITCP